MTYNERVMLGNVEKERDEALSSIDDMVDVIGKQIYRIARDNDDCICTRCISTSRVLFGLMKKYAREEDAADISREWKQFHSGRGRLRYDIS